MCRVAGVSEKAKKQAINPNLSVLSTYIGVYSSLVCRSDVTLFEFLEHYLQRLEGPLALQVWGRFLQLVKDMMSTSRDLKMQNYSLLRSDWMPNADAQSHQEIRQVYFGTGRQSNPDYGHGRSTRS
jgi:hypothetical protein